MSGGDAGFLSAKGEETLIFTHVQPRAAKSGLCGLFGQRLKIRIGSAPVDGEANRECIAFLARIFDLPKSEVRLLKGAQSRDKTFVVSRPIEFIRQKLDRMDQANLSKSQEK